MVGRADLRVSRSPLDGRLTLPMREAAGFPIHGTLAGRMKRIEALT